MIEIYNNNNGDVFRYDPRTHRLFKNGMFMTAMQAEPVYAGNGDGEPNFAGVYLPDIDSILTLTGNVKRLTAINNIH